MFHADPERLRVIRRLDELVTYLRDDLHWPIENTNLDEITFDWSTGDLRVGEKGAAKLRDGVVRQLQPFVPNQPWGVFLVEFTDGGLYRTALREILRGLVPKRRRDSRLPAWQHDNLLFLCTTTEYDRFTFVHFRGEQAEKARLASFGWDAGGNYLRTLCEFNLPCLRWPDDPADAEGWQRQWAAAFNKEPLTKEFFKRFDECLECVQADLQKHQELSSAVAYSKAQMLLERLLFLYFLQNRGWLNQQRRYLVESFGRYAGRPAEFSFYEEFLDRLFWTLASAPGSAARFDGIPFLNGGLFDDDDFAQTPIRFKHNPPLKVRNETFAFVFAHLLEAFNFTVREDTPLNQDVAVDPEMLGKVFESIVLHAEAADPDAVAPDKRKATGSYYTPRIVVHFICREALRQYLLTHTGDIADHEKKIKALFAMDATDGLDADELANLKQTLKPADGRRFADILADIKACDPAVGSGAFPVGLLHELVNLRRIAESVANGFVDPVRKEGHQWIHDTKAAIVAEGLYGVDIQQQAIEICRLRLWLSLIVDYDLGLDPFTADVQQFRQAIGRISQLPNLEMNFRRGDSLLDIISGETVRVAPEHSDRYRKEYERIHKLSLPLHNARKSERKRKLRVEILAERLTFTERVLTDEVRQLRTQDSVLAADWFGGSSSDAERRRNIAGEVKRIEKALAKVETDRRILERLAAQPMSADFNPRLRKLEGADFDSPFNFAWRLDFADILGSRPTSTTTTVGGEFGLVNDVQRQQELASKIQGRGGFDLILGNPPFVTARNPVKRELYRERWRRVCHKNYLLICPFFDLSFGLLRPRGQLGFIVSNAFAKREFGKPLVEEFFPTIDIQKVVDCSGLLFPGHGTPTCIVFGRNCKPDVRTAVLVTATLPGGGDLRTSPEESDLWQSIANHYNDPGHVDGRIRVGEYERIDIERWPWNFLGGSRVSEVTVDAQLLGDFCAEPVGAQFITGKDEAFVVSSEYLRRLSDYDIMFKPYANGEDVRNWSVVPSQFILFPYDDELLPLQEPLPSGMCKHLTPHKKSLEDCVVSGSTKKKETNLKWFEYRRLARAKFQVPHNVVNPHIATHCHFLVADHVVVFKEKAIAIAFREEYGLDQLLLVVGWLNTSLVLEQLKRDCFNKGAGEDEHRDRFEFAGEKLRSMVVANFVCEVLAGRQNKTADYLTNLSRACWERGQMIPLLAMKRLFEKPAESYHEWNSSLPGYVAPTPECGEPFGDAESFRGNLKRVIARREQLRTEMIALQEEMDWLVYAAYGLIPMDSPSVGWPTSVSTADWTDSPQATTTEVVPHLQREQRPFVLWQQAGGDFDKAAALIPSDWSDDRKILWRARFTAIRDNEHIRRIEQPVYKRRWDEQWKVGSRWQCGPIAYDAELVEAFDWWLSEKAEWWLEKKAKGGPVAIEKWTSVIGSDARVQAAWDVVSEALARLDRSVEFPRYFANTIKAQTVPDNIPIAVPWEKIKVPVPASAKRIRGKLNVPRERFRTTPDQRYTWAGQSC